MSRAMFGWRCLRRMAAGVDAAALLRRTPQPSGRPRTAFYLFRVQEPSWKGQWPAGQRQGAPPSPPPSTLDAPGSAQCRGHQDPLDAGALLRAREVRPGRRTACSPPPLRAREARPGRRVLSSAAACSRRLPQLPGTNMGGPSMWRDVRDRERRG
jgi:hypothetical protein